MAQRSRNFLFTGPFSNGQRPDENDFNDVWDSFINLADDPISLDGDNNYVLTNALRVGTTAGDVPGTIRFNGITFEFREAAAWVPLGSGGGGAFQEVGGGPDVAFSAGNVGINTGGSNVDFKLEVALGLNTSVAEQVRLGSAAIHTRTAAFLPQEAAYFSHLDFANDINYALSQANTGDVFLNARAATQIRFSVGNNSSNAMTFDSGGNLTIQEDLTVEGDVFNPGGGGTWNTSDMRTKKKVKPFKEGLELIKKINPINFEYNGKAGTRSGKERIGISGNEMEKIAPYTISKRSMKLNPKDKKETEVLVYNAGPLIYIAVNAIKELAAKVAALEKKIAG